MSQSPFVEKKLIPNPFGRFVGNPLNDEDVDVPEINAKAFDDCKRLLEDVLRDKSSHALTLHGEAGTGKTHLLGRMRRWLQQVPGSLFVPVRMDTSARMLWRHLRRCLADALLRPSAAGRTALDDLLGTRQAEVEQLAARDLCIILENLLKGVHLRDSAAWLRGQELPETALDRMDLAKPDMEENQEVASRDVVVSLCSVIEPSPVVFCLDQWEALQSFVGDTDGLLAAGQAVSLLHDPPTRNACIICCVQTGFLPVLEKLDKPVRDRMGLNHPSYLRSLDWEHARRLIAARLDSVQPLAIQRRERRDSLWPLSEQPIRQIFVANAAPARKVISHCKNLFEQWRTGEPHAEETLDDALQAMLDDRIASVEPADAEAAFRNGLPLVFRAMSLPTTSPVKGSPFDFVLHNSQQAVALCNQSNSTSLASRLKKIAEAWQPLAGQRLLLLRDARLPIAPSAKVTRQRLKSVEEKGGHFIPVSQEAIEALSALRRLTERYAKLAKTHIAKTGNTAREIWKLMEPEAGNKAQAGA